MFSLLHTSELTETGGVYALKFNKQVIYSDL
jgi:hypothetical protein